MKAAAEALNSTSWIQKYALGTNPKEDTGLQALVMAAKILGMPSDDLQIWHMHGKTTGAFEEMGILRVAKRMGLKAKNATIDLRRLDRLTLPALIRATDSRDFHVLESVTVATVTVRHPVTLVAEILSYKDLKLRFSPTAILLALPMIEPKSEKAFGFSWFIPTILKHAARFRRVVVASLFIQLFALVSPMLFQVVIDRVLVSRGLQSLDVLAIGLLAIAVFEPLMTFFRGLIFSHLASCVNSELSSRLFRHLIHLPQKYFVDRQSGEIIARVRELDNIRDFLTGSALMMVLDLAFVGVFLAVMFSYAPPLAWLVLASLAIYLLIWMAVAPILRRRVEKTFEHGADNTAFLTEAVTGMETIKSLGVGARFNREWDDRLAGYLKASFSTNMIGNWAGGSIGLVQKIIAAMLLWFGVQLVMSGGLTIGQLVAFNMLAGHVTMPILRLAQVWQDFQRAGVSIKRIGDILNEPTEAVTSFGRASMDTMRGDVELRKVTFRYSEDGSEVLRRLDLKVAAGEKIGITGLSGSGKSTITKLVQRLYVPQSGQVLVDGVDLAMADPAMLRRQMGVVLQESFLFNGSITENIGLGDPRADQDAIEEAARMAGAHEFITEMDGGYEAQVGERGGALSGGQRQRIAIARALVSQPAILIFDEATSALDYESEAAIIARLPKILEGRTAIMIAHRLNALRLCDRIVVMEKGEIIEEGTHETLLAMNGRYAELWAMQVGDQ